MTNTQTPRPNDKRCIYLNMKAPGCDRETVDEVRACDHATDKSWRWEADRLRREYIMAGAYVYQSQRACKGWN